MIYLIGGAPRSGKSILANSLSKSLELPLISIDDLRANAIAEASDAELTDKFPFEELYKEHDNDLFFEKYSKNEILAAEIAEAKTLWPTVRGLIVDKRELGQACVFEGVQLLPELVSELQQNDLSRIVFLIRLSEEQMARDFQIAHGGTDWLTSNTKNVDTYDKAARVYRHYGEFFRDEAEKYGLAYFVMDGDFEEQLNRVSAYLLGQSK